MRKIILATVLTVGILLSANAQKIEFGIKAGVNFASLSGDGGDGFDGRTSFHIGGILNYEISEKFAIQPELLYSAQGATFDDIFDDNFVDEGDDATFRLDYINIPVLADYTFAEGFSAQLGPQFGFNVNSEVEFNGDTEDADGFETFDIGIAGGFQYILEQGVFFQARYALGLKDIAQDADSKNSVLALSVGYKF